MKVTIDGTLIKFDGGEAGVFVFDASQVDAGLNDRAMMHGWRQRLGDCYAGAKNDAERLEAVRKLGEYYLEGATDWNVKGGAGGGVAGPSLTIRALAMVQGVEPEVMAQRVKEQAEKAGISEKGYLAKVRTLAAVQAAMEQLRPTKKPAVDAEALLNNLK